MTDITLWWRGYGSADINTDYQILSDEAASGTFVEVVVQDATSPYTPAITTLAETIDAETIIVVMADATDFANGDRVKIDGETIILGGKSSDTFSTCERSADNTIPSTHAAGTPIYLMHESYTDTGVTFGARHVIRYRVVTVLGSVSLVAAEATAVQPSLPETNDFTVIWGVLDQTWTDVISGVSVSLTIGDTDNFNPRSAETYYTSSQVTVTDDDGYWELIVPRAIARIGGDTLNLTVGNRAAFALRAVPDVDTICHLELI